MSSKFSMMKRIAVTTALVAGVSGIAYAADNNGLTRDQAFAEQNAYWQALSTPMPVGSPAVDRSAKPADPIPSATNLAQEEARFKVIDAQLQAESTNMPVGSPPVNKNEVAADPIPKATTLAQKEARFAAEDGFLERMSTH
jgi:hypothetical protein